MQIKLPDFIHKRLFKSKIPDEIKVSKIQSVLVSSGSGSAKWSEHNYESFADETYMKNVIAFRCIDEIGTAVSSVPWAIYEKKGSRQRTETKLHPVAQLIRRPNPEESFSYLMLKNACYFVMDGNSYMERVVLKEGPNVGIPKELYIHRPDRINIEVNTLTGRIAGYKYTVESREKMWYANPITGECDLWHFKAFHPTDDWYGASITEPTSREIDTSNEATEWNKKMLENEGRPGMVITFIGQNLSDERYEKLEKLLNEKHAGGATNAGRNLILEGEKGTDAKPYGWTPKDMDFLEGNRELARRIALGFRVPPQLLGIPGDNTFCVSADTEIATNTGNIEIQNIKEGDYVWTVNLNSTYKELELKKVLKVGQTGAKKLYRVEYNNGSYLDMTDNHVCIIKADYKGVVYDGVKQYYYKDVETKNLKVGDEVLSTCDLTYSAIEGMDADICCEYSKVISIEELNVQPVYDIWVEDNHNFFANGILVHNSNYEEARQAFWEESIFFYLHLFRDELNNWFFKGDERFTFDYILDEIPALSPKRHRMWERAQKSEFITTNEKRAMVGLGPVDGGDTILIPANMIPLSMVGEMQSISQNNQNQQKEDELVKQLTDEGYSKDDALKFLGLA